MYINKMQELVDSLVAAGHSSYLAKQLAITLCEAVVRSWEVVALREFLFQWE